MTDQQETRPDYRPGGRSGKGFMPGQSGNPAGRPKKPTLKEQIEAVLAETLPESGITKLEALARVWVDQALRQRDIRSMLALANKLYPTPRERPVEPDRDQPMFQMKVIDMVGSEKIRAEVITTPATPGYQHSRQHAQQTVETLQFPLPDDLPPAP